MTTESKQDAPRGASPLLVAALAAGLVVAVITATGALVGGTSAALGGLAGAGLALVVFSLGTTVVHVVSSAMPAASLLVALLTYTLQVVAMALAIVLLERAGVAGDELARGWFAAGVVAVTVVWLTAQVWQATHLRLPAYDLPDEGRPDRTEASAP